MADGQAGPLLRFHRLIAQARPPERADRAAGGLLPTRAFRYCEAITTASAFGWYVFPPISFCLTWSGDDIAWSYDGAEDWYPLNRAQFPDFSAAFDQAAPERVKGYAPPFLAALPEPGVVQVWSGLIARTRPEWSLLIRAPANVPRPAGYELFEGIVETDRWFGPLFSNIRLTRTDQPITFDVDFPLFQVQPLHRSIYSDERLGQFEVTPDLQSLSERDWNDYQATVIGDDAKTPSPLGHHAIEVRRRRRSEVPSEPD